MRRFHQAKRDRRTWTAELDYQFPLLDLSVRIDASYRKNDYRDLAPRFAARRGPRLARRTPQ